MKLLSQAKSFYDRLSDKNKGIILIDILIIISPILSLLDIGSINHIINIMGYFLVTLLVLSILGALFGANRDNVIEETKKETKNWKIYNIITDILISLVWLIPGFYSIFVMIIILRGLTLINYSEENK